MGEIGLTFQYYYSLTPRVFINTLIGYRKKEENKFKTSWQQARVVAYHSVMWGKNPPELEKFMPFIWEKNEEKVSEKPNRKAVENTFKKWDKLIFDKKE